MMTVRIGLDWKNAARGAWGVTLAACMCAATALAVTPGDLDDDSDVDLADWVRFQTCFGESGQPVAPGCEVADLDGDNDVDLADALVLAAEFTGPRVRRFGETGPRLNEVRFLPREGEPQFVELLIGRGGAELAGFKLINDAGEVVELPDGISDSVEGDIVLILFDGENRVDGFTIHIDRVGFLDDESDALRLAAPDDSVADVVQWGADRPGAVPLGRGGFISDPPRGSTIARLPGAIGPSSTAWLIYVPNEASPGANNPNPGVAVLRPSNGAIVPPGPLSLAWYAVPGVIGYRVEVAIDNAFNAIIIDQTVMRPRIVTEPVNPGVYFWRVEALYEDGRPAAMSGTRVIFVIEPGGGGSILEPTIVTLDPWSPTGRFPSLSQRKDTNMILLESDREDEGHRYDEPHAVLDEDDRADNGNCVNASLAMINRFYGGGISQDRIGYEVFHTLASGAEWDLNEGSGMSDPDSERAMRFALGGAPVTQTLLPGLRASPVQREQAWSDLTAEIDEGRPVMLIEETPDYRHATVLIGYAIHPDAGELARRLIHHDPWNPGSGEAIRSCIAFEHFSLVNYFRSPFGVIVGRIPSDEPSIGIDSDGDGVYDFDETERFKTDAVASDTDDDCLDDKDEIHMSMFHPDHGYALAVNLDPSSDGRARDLTTDSRPETDLDSDDGGMPDFMEDLNGNGRIDRALGETDPFDPTDDPTRIEGRSTFLHTNFGDNIVTSFRRLDQEWTLQVGPPDATYPNGRVSGSVRATYEQRTDRAVDADPPRCPQPRIIESFTVPVSVAFNVEGQFTCTETQPGMRGVPTLNLVFAPGTGPARFPATTSMFIDPCNGNSSAPFTPTIAVRSGNFGGGSVDTTGSAPGRIVWRTSGINSFVTFSQEGSTELIIRQ